MTDKKKYFLYTEHLVLFYKLIMVTLTSIQHVFCISEALSKLYSSAIR